MLSMDASSSSIQSRIAQVHEGEDVQVVKELRSCETIVEEIRN